MASEVNTGNRPNSKKGGVDICEYHTDFIATDYEDRLFIIITQFKKLGTLVQVRRDTALEQKTGIPTFSTQVVLGQDMELIHVLARNLAEKINIQKPILFALGIKCDITPQLLQDLNTHLQQVKVW